MIPQEIIRRKRDGDELDAADIRSFIAALAAGRLSEGQIGAFAMTPIDAQRRNNAIQEYRTTTSTIEDVADSNSGF